VPDGLIRFPDIICLTGSSTFLPVIVAYAMLAIDYVVQWNRESTGIPGVSKIYLGTCRGLRALRIASRIRCTRFSVNFRFGCIWTKRKTDSSRSCGRRCPTQTESITSDANCVSRTLYISADPKRMPDGLRTPSERPENMICLVTG
jgi:hypothetical protein